MGHKKLIRFAELETFANVLQYPKDMAGKWYKHFNNDNPIVLELACGKGEYTVGLAQMYPDKNFTGVDLKGNRMWVGAKKAILGNLSNVAFLRTQIDHINEYFGPGEIQEIWITFPDPQLRTGKAKKRLTHPVFLRRYKQILAPGGYIHLKTDSPDLYSFTMKIINMYNCTLLTDYDDVYKLENVAEALKIKTHYEGLDIAQSNRIHYLCFSLPDVLPGTEQDEILKEQLKQYEERRSG
jgi:tRNA (guanine-N7-)-methyltransferase